MQKLIKFLMVSMAFTALQVATVKAEEESLDGATQIFSGSEESSDKKKKIEQRDRKTEQRDQGRQDRDRKDTGSHVEEIFPSSTIFIRLIDGEFAVERKAAKLGRTGSKPSKNETALV